MNLTELQLVSTLSCTTNIVYDDNHNPVCIMSSMKEKEKEIVIRELSQQAETLSEQNKFLQEQYQELDTEKITLEFENQELSRFLDKKQTQTRAREESSLQAQELDYQNKLLLKSIKNYSMR